MTPIVGGTAAGAAAAALIIYAGTAAIWIAAALATLAVIAGAVDYVRTH